MVFKVIVYRARRAVVLRPATRAQSATVYWNNVDQEIDGFGASTAFEGGRLTSSQASFFFSSKSGIGLSLLRTMVPYDGSCVTVNAICAPGKSAICNSLSPTGPESGVRLGRRPRR